MHAVWPEHLPLTARFGVLEFDGRDEAPLTQSIDLVRQFKDSGLDFIDVGIGFSTPHAQLPWGANFVASIAERVRNETGLPGSTRWYISDAVEADAMIEYGRSTS